MRKDAEEQRFLGRRVQGTVNAAIAIVLTALSVSILFAIVGHIFVNGVGSLNADFFTKIPKPYGETGGGIAPAIAGTIVMLLVAGIIAVPIGIGTAIYIIEFGQSRFAEIVRFTIELLAELPSIVVGVFVWALLVRNLTGYSGAAGACALAVIMIPIIARSVEEILKLVPDGLRESALALGTPKWKVVLFVVIPTVLPGILTGVMLSLARAAGETAPLLLTALGNSFFNLDLRRPMAAMPLPDFNYAVSPWRGEGDLVVDRDGGRPRTGGAPSWPAPRRPGRGRRAYARGGTSAPAGQASRRGSGSRRRCPGAGRRRRPRRRPRATARVEQVAAAGATPGGSTRTARPPTSRLTRRTASLPLPGPDPCQTATAAPASAGVEGMRQLRPGPAGRAEGRGGLRARTGRSARNRPLRSAQPPTAPAASAGRRERLGLRVRDRRARVAPEPLADQPRQQPRLAHAGRPVETSGETPAASPRAGRARSHGPARSPARRGTRPTGAPRRGALLLAATSGPSFSLRNRDDARGRAVPAACYHDRARAQRPNPAERRRQPAEKIRASGRLCLPGRRTPDKVSGDRPRPRLVLSPSGARHAIAPHHRPRPNPRRRRRPLGREGPERHHGTTGREAAG